MLLLPFQQFVADHGLSASASPTLLAVSGGLDSVVMAHLFREAGLPFGIAHCNFQLRGAASDADAAFVEKMAADWGLPFFLKNFDTSGWAVEQGVSIQMAARSLRYEWFKELCREHGYAHLATAHHLNDSVETLVLHFARGTGLKGLRGIPAQNQQVLRPLLAATRSEILAYAEAHAIAWREDSSNADDHYTRNFIRRQVLPRLQAINPGFLQSAQKMMARMEALSELTDGMVADFFERKMTPAPDGSLRMALSELRKVPYPTHLLFLFAEKKGFTEEQCRQMVENSDKTGLQIKAEKTGWQLLQDRGDLLFIPPTQVPADRPSSISIQSDDLLVTLPDGLRLLFTPAAAAPPFPDGRMSVLVDADKLQFPLHLRSWQPGDWFQPFGLGGQRQKLQDFFVNQKISRPDKARAKVLENGDGAIVWVLGYRSDERFRVRQETKNALKITSVQIAP